LSIQLGSFQFARGDGRRGEFSRAKDSAVFLAVSISVPAAVSVAVSLRVAMSVTVPVLVGISITIVRTVSLAYAGSLITLATVPMSIMLHAAAGRRARVAGPMESMYPTPVMRDDHGRGMQARVASHIANYHVNRVLPTVAVGPMAPRLEHHLKRESDLCISPERIRSSGANAGNRA
jgi:hypothetical protein